MKRLHERVNADRVELELPADRSFHPVGRLVAAGVGSRAGLDVDRIDDLQLALDAVLGRRGARGPTRMALTSSEADLLVEIGPVPASDFDAGLERVLSRFVPQVEMRRSPDELSVAFRLPARYASVEGR